MELIEIGFECLARSLIQKGVMKVDEAVRTIGRTNPAMANDALFQGLFPDIFAMELCKYEIELTNRELEMLKK